MKFLSFFNFPLILLLTTRHCSINQSATNSSITSNERDLTTRAGKEKKKKSERKLWRVYRGGEKLFSKAWAWREAVETVSKGDKHNHSNQYLDIFPIPVSRNPSSSSSSSFKNLWKRERRGYTHGNFLPA